jgi:hypothetical protein
MKTFTITSDDHRVLKDLAYMVLKSKQNVGQKMRDTADSARKILSRISAETGNTQQPMKKQQTTKKSSLTTKTPPRRAHHGDEPAAPKKKAPAKKPAAKKPAAPKAEKPKPEAAPADPAKPVIPDHREDIQAPYHFTPEEIAAMNVGLRTALDDIETLESQAKAAAQDFKLRITNKRNEVKQYRNKLTAGEETRPMKAAVEFLPKKSVKRFLDPETGVFIREEQMQPADWQLPMFKPEEIQSPKPPATPPPAGAPSGPAGTPKPAKAPKSSPAGETSVGDAMDKAAAKEKAPQFWIDLGAGDWTDKGLTAAYKKAAKGAGWSNAQISALADRLKEASTVEAMIDTLRPFVISEEDRFMYVEVPEEGAVRVQRLDVALPDGFPLEKVTGTFRKAAKAAEWSDSALELVVAEAERQARVIGDEPEATETATRHLRNYCIIHV